MKAPQAEFPREGHYDDSTVAFCVPKGYNAGGPVDFVVLLHGHINTCESFISQSRAGEALERSGRNAIVVVPQGPKNAPDSGGGKFEKPGGFAVFLDEALATLKASNKVPSDAQPGAVVLCGYSGGGRPAGFILRNGDAAGQIREVWLMDAAYQQRDGLAKPFARERSSTVLRSVFTGGMADENMEIMSRITRGGGRVALVRDDDLTTAGAPGHRDGPQDELALVLWREPALFIRTPLPHDVRALSDRFLELLLRESPVLTAR